MPVRRGIRLIFIARMFGAYVSIYSDRFMVSDLPLNVAACSATTTTLQYIFAQPAGLISYTNHEASFHASVGTCTQLLSSCTATKHTHTQG